MKSMIYLRSFEKRIRGWLPKDSFPSYLEKREEPKNEKKFGTPAKLGILDVFLAVVFVAVIYYLHTFFPTNTILLNDITIGYASLAITFLIVQFWIWRRNYPYVEVNILSDREQLDPKSKKRRDKLVCILQRRNSEFDAFSSDDKQRLSLVKNEIFIASTYAREGERSKFTQSLAIAETVLATVQVQTEETLKLQKAITLLKEQQTVV